MGIFKQIPCSNAHTDSFVVLTKTATAGLVKAANTSSYSQKLIDRFNKRNKKIPTSMYFLVSIVSAGEYWGPNLNDDYFPEDELLRTWETFKTGGNYFLYHQNDDPKKRFGIIVDAIYNHNMHRVEILVEAATVSRMHTDGIIINALPADAKEALEDGTLNSFSMGCHVPYDLCSNCGHKRTSEPDKCPCHRTRVGFRRAYLINMSPKFYDGSSVHVPADTTARILKKVAKRMDKLGNFEEEMSSHLPKGAMLKGIGEILNRDLDPMYSYLAGFSKGYGPSSTIDIDFSHPEVTNPSLSDWISYFDFCDTTLNPSEFLSLLNLVSGNVPRARKVLNDKLVIPADSSKDIGSDEVPTATEAMSRIANEISCGLQGMSSKFDFLLDKLCSIDNKLTKFTDIKSMMTQIMGAKRDIDEAHLLTHDRVKKDNPSSNKVLYKIGSPVSIIEKLSPAVYASYLSKRASKMMEPAAMLIQKSTSSPGALKTIGVLGSMVLLSKALELMGVFTNGNSSLPDIASIAPKGIITLPGDDAASNALDVYKQIFAPKTLTATIINSDIADPAMLKAITQMGVHSDLTNPLLVSDLMG